MDTDGALVERVFDDISASDLSARAQELALGAVLGPDDLASVLAGVTGAERPAAPPAAPTPPAMYLSDITVAGFRGVASKTKLGLTPGPGLTLVVGRNGSGKSTFSDACELALTGSAARWENKTTKVWQEGWKNLHHDAERSVEVRLSIDGEPGTTDVVRTWAKDEDLAGGTSTAQRPGTPKVPAEQLGLGGPLRTYRPFLSYSELAGLLESGPSKLYDAISGVLGLQELTDAVARLTAARKDVEEAVKDEANARRAVKAALAENPDPRAATAAKLIAKRPPDLDALAALIAGAGSPEAVDGLPDLAALKDPDVDAVSAAVARLREATAKVAALAGSDAARADRLATLLDAALSSVTAGACPVCGTPDAIGDDWAGATRSELDRLRQEAHEVRTAERELAAATVATTALRDAVASPRDVDGVDTTALSAAVATWRSTPLDALGAALPELLDALAGVRTAAQGELERRADTWQPAAVSLAAWLDLAQEALLKEPMVKDLKAAADWLTGLAGTVRDERFAPIADQVQQVWERLRQSSSVTLDQVELSGKSANRKVELKVSVDGSEGGALAVMSQGELHAVALSLFLPRATLPESPFRFVLIDDPVQAMDAARVDGLARTLQEVAAQRQVIVFTHDARLPEACRRLDVPARVLEVARGDRSEITIRRLHGPSANYLSDARAILKSEAFPKLAQRRVVPGLCRHAVEAACIDVVRRRRIEAGHPHDAVEEMLDRHAKLMERLALAVYDDADRAGEIYGWANAKLKTAGGDTVRALNAGAHELIDDNPDLLVNNSERLVKVIEAVR